MKKYETDDVDGDEDDDDFTNTLDHCVRFGSYHVLCASVFYACMTGWELVLAFMVFAGASPTHVRCEQGSNHTQRWSLNRCFR